MHLFDPAAKFGCSGIIGAGFPPAVGAALAAKMQHKDWVAVAFAGEGAGNQGSFHECLNLAALWKLPVVFVMEDNSWAISVPKKASTAVATNADRASAYGIPGVYVPENDPIAVSEVAGPAVERARRGGGPTLMEVKTFRYLGHFQGDPETFRPKGEVESLKKKDALKAYEARLKAGGVLDDARIKELRDRAKARVDASPLTVSFLKSGTYKITVSTKGFNNAEIVAVIVRPGTATRANATLSPKGRAETITVTSEAPAIQEEARVIAGTLNTQQIQAAEA